ncbi:MAG: glycoside hydrolase family 28 protein [Halobacteriaceae archaeon]
MTDLQADIDAAAGGGTVRVPPGVHETGPLRLRSGVTLELAPGAVLRGPAAIDGYGDDTHLLVADGAENVAVTGRGTIDGRGTAFMTDEPIGLDIPGHSARQGEDYPLRGADAPRAPRERPDGLVRFADCAGVAVEGVTLTGSPAWTLHCRACDDVTVSGVTIDNDPRIPNSDGVVPDMCRDVRVSDCRIRTGDDAIPVKATGQGGVRDCENVAVTNCVLASRSGAVFVGGRAAGDIRHVVVSDCVVRESNRGLAVRAYGPGAVEDVRVSNVTVETRLFAGNWWGQAEPVYVAAHPHRPGVDCGGVRDLTLSGVTATAEQGAFLYAGDGATIEGVTLDDVSLRVVGGEHTDSVGGNFDVRWITDDDAPEGRLPDIYAHDVPGVYARGVTDLALRNVAVEWGDDPPAFFSSAVACEAFAGLAVDGLVGRGATPDDPVVDLRDGREIRIRDSTATAGAGRFLSLADTAGERLFAGNDLGACEDAGPVGAFAVTDAG